MATSTAFPGINGYRFAFLLILHGSIIMLLAGPDVDFPWGLVLMLMPTPFVYVWCLLRPARSAQLDSALNLIIATHLALAGAVIRWIDIVEGYGDPWRPRPGFYLSMAIFSAMLAGISLVLAADIKQRAIRRAASAPLPLGPPSDRLR